MPPQKKRNIAICCQGGGSQTAFTAGALKSLYDHGFGEHYRLTSITGTSGGALCAVMVWYAALKKDAYMPRRMLDLWADNTAQTKGEEFINDYLVESLRAVNRGQMPQFNLSPYAPMMQMMARMSSALSPRPGFTDFRALLQTHIDFTELEKGGARPDMPALLIGAAEILTGQMVKFNSRKQAIRIEHILASCAIPTIFEAVEFDGQAYWDGLFSDNPPIEQVIDAEYVGEDNHPEEIWVIKINPTGSREIPKTSEAISGRRNEMIGNMSLFHQLQTVHTLNELLLRKAFSADFLKNAGISRPIFVPSCRGTDERRAYHIPFIEMSDELQQTLDTEGKLDRNQKNIRPLMADGEKQAAAFIENRIAALQKGE